MSVFTNHPTDVIKSSFRQNYKQSRFFNEILQRIDINFLISDTLSRVVRLHLVTCRGRRTG